MTLIKIGSLDETLGIEKNVPLQQIDIEQFGISGYKLFIKRMDLIHPIISGNKWFKLKYNIHKAIKDNQTNLLTFGGSYSNHIYAIAAAGKILGFKTTGIIRGEEHLPLNPTLAFANFCGMNIHYISRENYRKKNDPVFISDLKKKFGEFYLIPEGGTNQLAVEGCNEILKSVYINFDVVVVPVGTGGTFAGIINNLSGKQKAIGIAVLKNAGFLEQAVSGMITNSLKISGKHWVLNLDYHFGGYAKYNAELICFINEFKDKTDIPSDPVYTGKMLFGIFDMMKNGYFRKNSTIVAIHTGGLQGIEGFNQRFGDLVNT